ncbi:MAG: hypothetical protein ACHQIM_11885, partial [Sphingobacteriales bacterium]
MKSIISGAVISTAILLLTIGTSCKKNSSYTAIGKNITTAPHANVDRFSSAFGHIFVRTATNGLPAANTPINMDVAPFITHGLNPDGTPATYYNFDVLPSTPDDIYVFFKQSAPTVELTAQNHVIPTKPGDAGYNDFWRVNKVMVPDNYVPNSLTNETAILNSGYTIIHTNEVVNCPVVPFGSAAALTYGSNAPQSLVIGWYKDSTIAYFTFNEAKTPLTLTTANQAAVTTQTLTSATLVPTADIFVFFANNTDPSMGFATVTGSTQTHN